MGGPQGQVDYFISYTSADRAWAEWIAWQLREAGSSLVLQAWDMVPGRDFIHEMQKATTTAKRTIAVLSPAYFTSQFGEAEWRVAFANDPDGEKGRLVPVRVADFTPEGLLATRVYIDLVGKDRPTAKSALLDGLKGEVAAVPTKEPDFPGEGPAALRSFTPPPQEPRFPAQGPSITNLPRRNLNFTGRTKLLEGLHNALQSSAGSAVTQTEATEAISGLGGIGKTQLALEYAHRYASDYDLIWWIGAEQPTTVIAALAELAGRLGIAERPDQTKMVDALWEELRGRDRWLLVFDNAEQPADLQPFLPPGGRGHVLVTSRWAAWGEWARPLHLGVLSREEAVAFVCKRIGTQDEQAAGALAEVLGDLPLALAEAGAYIEETQVSLDEYLQLVQERAVELFGLDRPAAAERRVATVWSLSLERVQEEAPAAEALLQLCAFLAPDDIPRSLPREHAALLPEELGQLARDLLAYNKALGVLGRYSLATVTPAVLGLHRLVQAVIRARLDDREGQWAQAAVELIDAAFPKDSWELGRWPTCERLLPHLLAVTDHAKRLHVADEQTGDLLSRASIYLRGRGQPRQARPVAERALTVTQQALGPDDPTVGDRHDGLGRTLREVGDYQAARQQLERALVIHQTAYGPDSGRVGYRHNELGNVLADQGDLAGARTEYERALEIGEATLSPNHREMAVRHSNLGLVLRELGDLAGARTHLERALEIGQATVGPNHPDMAIWHSGLGLVLRELGDLAGARTHHERALAIGQATVGPDHPLMATVRGNIDNVLQRLGGE